MARRCLQGRNVEQRTLLCTRCEKARGACHFCLKIHWCIPPEALARNHKAERTVREEQRTDLAGCVLGGRWHFIDVVD